MLTASNWTSRKLRLETLEPRLALTASPADAGSLEEYLTEPVEMGPVADPAVLAEAPDATTTLDPVEIASDSVTPGPLDAGAVDSALLDLQGEGEGPGMILNPLALTLTSFTAEHVDGGWVRLSGTVSGGYVAGTMVFFGGLIGAQMAICDASGSFTHFVPDPGVSGYIVAYVPMATNYLTAYLD